MTGSTIGPSVAPAEAVEKVDLGTLWWARAKAYERAAMRHCEATLQVAADEYAAHARENFPDDWTPCAPAFEDYDLWAAFDIDWMAVRDRIKPNEETP